MKEQIVICENLSKTFTVGSSKVKAVDGLSINFERGEFSSIVGPSGSGKTTLLNLVGTLEVPTEGKIIINGTDLSNFEKGELTNFRRKNLGFVFQFFNLIEGLTTFENIELPLIFDSVPYERRKEAVNSLIQDFDLDHLRNKFPEELSSGERQRVSIMRALVHNLNKERGTSILLVTHDLSAAKRANRTLHMHDGKITFDMKIEEMIKEGI
jgi:putative ABC transport system ATP-binding protein